MCRQESNFAYLFGVVEPGFYGAIVSSPFFDSLHTQSLLGLMYCIFLGCIDLDLFVVL